MKVEQTKIPSGVASYKLYNPRLTTSFPPQHIAESTEYWFIPEKDSKDPILQLTWRFRIFSNAAAGLRLLEDYRNADFVLVAPRINPNYDSIPAFSAFRNRFGEVTSASVVAGGLKYSWNQSDDKEFTEKLFSPKRQKQESEYVGQLIYLRSEKVNKSIQPTAKSGG